MGRPVVLPDCNIGHDLVDGRSALLLREGDGLEIAARVEQLLDDPELRGRLAEGRAQLRARAARLGAQLARPRPLLQPRRGRRQRARRAPRAAAA